MIRLFAALQIPPEIAEGLIRRQHGLEGARWRPAEAFHITLRFFGDLREDVAADLDAELAGVAGRKLTLELAGVGAFAEGEDIHAVWAGVEDHPDLRQLAKSCEAAARRAGLAADKRVYRPHVTLAYLRRPGGAAVAQWIQANNLIHSPPFTVGSFGLYSSHQTAEGSRYRLERSYPLG
jgi:2'-5' RNA ligase